MSTNVSISKQEAELICRALLLYMKVQQTSLQQANRASDVSRKFLALIEKDSNEVVETTIEES